MPVFRFIVKWEFLENDQQISICQLKSINVELRALHKRPQINGTSIMFFLHIVLCKYAEKTVLNSFLGPHKILPVSRVRIRPSCYKTAVPNQCQAVWLSVCLCVCVRSKLQNLSFALFSCDIRKSGAQ